MIVGEVLPNQSEAFIDPNKFENYILKAPGKVESWVKAGFDVQTAAERAATATKVIRQIGEQLPNAPVVSARQGLYGVQATVNIDINLPNGGIGNLVTTWQYDTGSEVPRLTTGWLKS